MKVSVDVIGAGLKGMNNAIVYMIEKQPLT